MTNDGMLKENALKGKVALVTGGATGLGKSMAKYFLELGADVVIASRKQEVLDASSKELMDLHGGTVLGISCDVRNYDEVENTLKIIDEKFGKLDILVNNAAGNFISPTERLSHRAFNIVLDIVLKGTCNFSLSVGKKWIDKKQKGKMLNIVTTYAWTGSGYVVPSAAAKGGVLSLTRSLVAIGIGPLLCASTSRLMTAMRFSPLMSMLPLPGTNRVAMFSPLGVSSTAWPR